MSVYATMPEPGLWAVVAASLEDNGPMLTFVNDGDYWWLLGGQYGDGFGWDQITSRARFLTLIREAQAMSA